MPVITEHIPGSLIPVTAADDRDGHDLRRLARCLPGHRLHACAGPVAVHSLATHTDAVQAGALFFCLPGNAHDGHRWAAVAVHRGAAALVVESPLRQLAGTPQLEVPDARSALARMARVFHGYPDRRLLLLAVTGTNGKTTTAYMLQSIFGAARRPLGLLGTVCYRLGRREVPSPLTTPDAALLHAMLAEIAAAGLQGVALEASSHALAQQRLEGVEVDTAVFTNLSRDHLDYHGSVMSYFAAKRRLFRERAGRKPFPALAVVCVDGAPGRLIAREAARHRQVITYGLERPADISGRYRPSGSSGGVLAVSGDWGSGEIHLPLPGRHNAQNALAAAAAALGNGVPFDTLAHAIATMEPVPGRFETVAGAEGFTVVVDFAHNPDGLRWALLAARRRAPGRVRLVFGCKGGDGDDGKRRRMGDLAGHLADVVYLTTDDPYDEDPAEIASRVEPGLISGRAAYRVVLDRAEAVRGAILEAEPGDLVLVAGRGHELYQPIRGGRVYLDDRQLCRNALAERAALGAAADVGARGW